MLLGAAALLAARRDRPARRRRVLLPARRGGAGRRRADDPRGRARSGGVGTVYALHLWSQFEAGTVHVRSGPVHGGPGRVHRAGRRQGGHGALPHTTRRSDRRRGAGRAGLAVDRLAGSGPGGARRGHRRVVSGRQRAQRDPGRGAPGRHAPLVRRRGAAVAAPPGRGGASRRRARRPVHAGDGAAGRAIPAVVNDAGGGGGRAERRRGRWSARPAFASTRRFWRPGGLRLLPARAARGVRLRSAPAMPERGIDAPHHSPRSTSTSRRCLAAPNCSPVSP